MKNSDNRNSWKNVYVFISSTFNDMHAERDYLVKKVFPKLRVWCNERHLKLIDIDLRWGVSEEDATRNKRVVDVCLKNIDKSRPFFLCLMGQRRGWVPGREDINSDTLKDFPILEKYLGVSSVTELEIIHALLEPLDGESESIRHSLFYFRGDEYLSDIADKDIRDIFSPEKDAADAARELNEFKSTLKKKTEVYDYHARWNDALISPELSMASGKDLSRGRLCDFCVEDTTLSEHILAQLKEEILKEFPERAELAPAKDEFEAELARQEVYLFVAADGYISRPTEEDKIIRYVESNGFQEDRAQENESQENESQENESQENEPYLLAATAGSGKTSLLAHLIYEEKIPGQVIYRFAGTTAASSTVSSTLEGVYTELYRRGYIGEEDKEKAVSNPMFSFDKILMLASKSLGEEILTLIFDAADQWGVDFDNAYWIPRKLPDNIRLLISIKNDADSEKWQMFQRAGITMHELSRLAEEDKGRIITGYLSEFLKAVDEWQLKKITTLQGSNNPLFLKIVLQELRIHGSFDTLMQQLEKDYGSTPAEAFSMVLERLERENFCDFIDNIDFIKYVLGILACSRENLTLSTMPGFFQILKNGRYKDVQESTVMDGVYALVNHLSPYLMQDGGRVGYLYDSFRLAVKERYREDLPEFYNLLSQLYDFYCNREGGGDTFVTSQKNTITCLADYILQADGIRADVYYDNPWFLLYMLRKTGVFQTMHAYEMADKAGWGNDNYWELVDIIGQASSRIKVCPHIVFYEMKRKSKSQNTVVQAMLERIQRELDAQFLYPAYTNEISDSLLKKEILFPESEGKSYTFVIKGYLVFVERVDSEDFEDSYTVITMMSIDSEMILKKVYLDTAVTNCYSDGEYLYVTRDYGDAWETFSFPTIESVSGRCQFPEVSDDRRWYRCCYGFAGKRYEKCGPARGTGEMTLYNMENAAEVVSYLSEGTNSSYDDGMCGPYYYIEDILSDCYKLWYIPKGTLLIDDNCKQKSYLLTYEDRVLYVVQSRWENGCLTGTEYIRFTELEDGSIEKTTGELPTGESRIGGVALCHQYLYVFLTKEVMLFDSDMNYVGRTDLNVVVSKWMGEVNPKYNTRFMSHKSGEILIQTNDKLLVYSEEVILRKARERSEEYGTTPSIHENIDTIVFPMDPYLALFKDTASLISLKDASIVVRGDDRQPLAVTDRAKKFIMGYSTYAASIFSYTDRMGEKRRGVEYVCMDTLRSDIRFKLESEEGWQPVGTFPCAEDIAVVFTSVETESLPYTCRYTRGRKREYSRVKICFYRRNYLENTFVRTGEWAPDFLVENSYIHVMSGWRKTWFFLNGVRIDDEYEEMQAYCVEGDKNVPKCHIKWRHAAEDIFSYYETFNDEYCEVGNQFIVRRISYIDEITSEKSVVIFDLNDDTVSEVKVPGKYMRGGENEVFILNSEEYTVSVCSLKEKRVTLTFSTYPYKHHSLIIKKFGGIFIAHENGMCSIYSAQDGHLMHQQLLETGVKKFVAYENADYIFVQTPGSKYDLYRMAKISELDQLETKVLS